MGETETVARRTGSGMATGVEPETRPIMLPRIRNIVESETGSGTIAGVDTETVATPTLETRN